MKVAVIINPASGASKQRAQVRSMIARLRITGAQVVQKVTTGPGDAKSFTEKIVQMPGQIHALIVVGGDGTICEVANALTGTQVPLVVWPTGTENLFAKSFGFRADSEVTLSCLLSGQIRPIDVGVANGRSFLIVAGIGFDAEVVHRLVRIRRGHITHLSYAGPLWRTFWEHRFPPLRVICQGRVYWEGYGMVFVGNMARYSLGLNVVRDAQPDDGLLDLLILPCRGKVELIGHSLRTIRRRQIEHHSALYDRCTNIRVESKSTVPVELDGEAAGNLPVDLTIRPAAIRVRVPPAGPIG